MRISDWSSDVCSSDLKVVRAARGADKALIAVVALFDVYRGQGVEPGKKSLAIAVTLQPRDATLTDQEIDAVAAKVVAQVSAATGGSLSGRGASRRPAPAARTQERRVGKERVRT